MAQWVWSEGNIGCVLEGIRRCGPLGILEISGCVLEMIIGCGLAGITRCGLERISGSGPGCVF